MGDTHGRANWKIPFYKEEWDLFIFIGDYFDTHDDISSLHQLYNFLEIVKAKKESKKEVVMLIGNHDFHYFPEIGYNGTSGYQSGVAKSFEYAINEERDQLQMAYARDNLLFTHAGVGEGWMERLVKNKIADKLPKFNAPSVAEFVNDMFKYKPMVFNFTGSDPTGNDMGQTPIWIRPLSLTKDTHTMREHIVQIVGHTGQHTLKLDEVSTLNHKYYFIDTLGTSGEYLIIEDGKFSTGKC